MANIFTIFTFLWCGAVFTVFGASVAGPVNLSAEEIQPTDVTPVAPLRLCIPDNYLRLCQEMVETLEQNNTTSSISCVGAPDKISCISEILKGAADWMALHPEELYVAHRFLPKDGFRVISEIRSLEFATRNYRYAPVAVVRRSANITKLSDLRGKRSCHTGFGKTAGWRVPFAQLFKSRLLNCSAAPQSSAIEQDLTAMKSLFGATCAPGPWVSDPQTDAQLKEKYPELCSLCANPETCSASDNYSNYEGALRCLIENDGDVAWTKEDAVRQFFTANSALAETSDEYELLCPDNSRMPVNSAQLCPWALRPWRTFVMTHRFAENSAVVVNLQQQITTLHQSAQQTTPTPEWYTKVLDFFKATDVPFHLSYDQIRHLSPITYLRPTKYLNSIWHPSCGVMQPSLQICVESQLALEKCENLKMAALGQRIQPGFSCTLGLFPGHCARQVASGNATVLLASAEDQMKLQHSKTISPRLVPTLREVEPESLEHRLAVVVIQENLASQFNGEHPLEGLRNLRSCHGDDESLTGYHAPVSTLRQAGELNGTSACDTKAHISALSLTQPAQVERYSGSRGAMRCLEDNVADIAFTDSTAVLATELSQAKLLCPNGTVTDLQNCRECHWGVVSSHKILATPGNESAATRENARLSLLQASALFKPGGKQEKVFRMFGNYYGNANLLFQSSSQGLQNEYEGEKLEVEQRLVEEYRECGATGGRPKHHGV